MSISDEQLDTLVRMAYKKTDIKKGQVLIQQGDLFADKFYVVEAGEFSFHKAKKGGECETDRKRIDSD